MKKSPSITTKLNDLNDGSLKQIENTRDGLKPTGSVFMAGLMKPKKKKRSEPIDIPKIANFGPWAGFDSKFIAVEAKKCREEDDKASAWLQKNRQAKSPDTVVAVNSFEKQPTTEKNTSDQELQFYLEELGEKISDDSEKQPTTVFFSVKQLKKKSSDKSLTVANTVLTK
jgi:hypothetical protein